MTRRAKVIVAATVALVALLVSGAVWLTGDSRTAGQPTPPTAVPSPAGQSKCGLVGSPGIPTALPAKWENVAGWYLPVSATDGPGDRSPTGPWSCYARTPAGAVIAAYVIAMRSEGVAEDWKSVVRTQTMPGPGQTVKLASTPKQTAPEVPKGFAIAAYSDTHATITYYLQQGTLNGSCNISVTWANGDWRLELENDGGDSAGCTLTAPSSFVPWGPG